jgi:dihydroorotate dehydrogenase electron transfer subunit
MATSTPDLASLTSPDFSRRARFDGVVEINRPMCREHYLLRVRLPKGFPDTLPGQFIQIGCRPPTGDGQAPESLLGADITWDSESGAPLKLCQAEITDRLALLRRPFSLSGRGDDAQGAWIEIVHRVVGIGTDWLSKLEAGDSVDLIGPLGNSFTPTPGKKLALMVGGGVGLPPMFYLSQSLARQGWDAIAFVGALTQDLLAVTFQPGMLPDPHGKPGNSVAQFAISGHRSVVTTDDGSLGLKGRITAGLEILISQMSQADKDNTVVFTCGPEPMMHAVAKLAEAAGIQTQVCMEQAMACGMGTCQSCIIKIDPTTLGKGEAPHGQTPAGRPWRYKLACTDGPVFTSTQVVW